MRLMIGSAAAIAAMALSAAASAGGYTYGAIGYDLEGGHMFSISATVQDVIIYDESDGLVSRTVGYKVSDVTFSTSEGEQAIQKMTYQQFSEGLVGAVTYGVKVGIMIDAFSNVNFSMNFASETDPATLTTYSNLEGSGSYYDDIEIAITAQGSLNASAVPGAGALPLAGLAGLAVGRRRRRSNK